MNIVDADSRPHAIMIHASHRRAPNRFSARPLGTPNNTYPSEKIPAPTPKMVSLKSRSSSSRSCAKLTFHAVQVGHHVDQEEERHQPAGGLPDRALLERQGLALTAVACGSPVTQRRPSERVAECGRHESRNSATHVDHGWHRTPPY